MKNFKHYLVLLGIFNPFTQLKISSNPFTHNQRISIVAMVPPPGGHVSRQAVNKVNPPGCSVNTSITTKEDGSREERQTLTCTKVTVTKDGKKVKEKPGSSSKQKKEDKKLADEFFSR